MINKFILLLCLSLFVNSLYASEIYVYSKTDQDWNRFMAQKIQQILLNFDYSLDCREYKSNENTIVTTEEISEYISEDAQGFLKKIEDLSGLSLLNIVPEIEIEKLGYSIEKLDPVDIKSESVHNKLNLYSDVTVNGIKVFADSFNINFVLRYEGIDKKLIPLSIRIKKTQLSFRNKKTLPLKFTTIPKIENDELSFRVAEFDKEILASTLESSLEDFDFTLETIEVPKVSLEIMGRTISVKQDEFVELIHNQKESVKEIILNQLVSLVRKGTIEIALDGLEAIKIPTSTWINTTDRTAIPLFFNLNSIESYRHDILSFGLQSYSCSSKYFNYGVHACRREKKIETSSQNERNLEMIKYLFDKKQAQFIASISENFINDLLNSFDENGILSEAIKNCGINLGDKRVQVKFNSVGDTAKVYIDAVYDVGALKGLLLSERYLNFPVILDLNISFKKIDGITHLVFSVIDVDLDFDILMNGDQVSGIESNVKNVRYGFRNIVVDKIKEELFSYDKESQIYQYKKWVGVELPPIPVPQVNHLDLEKIKFINDGLSRANLYFSKDILNN